MPQKTPLRDYKASVTDPEDLAALGKWQEAFDYRIWSARLSLDAPQFQLFEMLSEGILEIPQQGSRLMHLIKAGVPHHVSSQWGYWAVSDTDRIWIRAEWQGYAYYTIIMGGTPSAYQSDRLRWYCPQCGAVSHEVVYETAQQGWRGFWDAEVRAVEQFNTDASLRTCPACSSLHPFAYSFFADQDTPEAQAARHSW